MLLLTFVLARANLKIRNAARQGPHAWLRLTPVAILLLCFSGLLSWAGCSRARREQSTASETDSHQLIATETSDEPLAPQVSVPSSGSDRARHEIIGVDALRKDSFDVGERLLLLLPRGPLVIELQVTVDGHPLREPREELVDEMLELADRDHDGRATWGEVFADPKRIIGQSLTRPLSLSNRKEFMKANDANRNGLVDRDEARRFAAQIKQSEAVLSVNSAVEHPNSGGRYSIARKLLDADGDGVLDRRELAALEQRLRIRDINDDRIITWPELDDSLAADELALGQRKSGLREDPVARLLGPTANFSDMDDAVEPHLVVAVAFGKAEKENAAPRLALKKFSPQLIPLEVSTAPQQVAVFSSSATFRLRFVADDRTAPAGPMAPQLSAVCATVFDERDVVFSILDADRDNRLTTRELRGGAAALGKFDTDNDGRIISEELPESLVILLGRGQPSEPPLLPQTFTSADDTDAAPGWFQYMDANGDREISREEFPGSIEKFRSLDLDNDGFITPSEAHQADSVSHR